MGYYDSIAEGYDELYSEEQLSKLDIIKNHLKINKRTRIIDVGCGTGISSDFNCFVVGIDKSIGLLKLNKSNKKLAAMAEFLPFKDNSFDCAISLTSIHNFSDIKKSISEMKRVATGMIVIGVLRKSPKFPSIKQAIENSLYVEKTIEEQKDAIFFCRKRQNRLP